MVNDEEAKKFDVIKNVLEYMKPYMNFELYKHEKDHENDVKTGKTKVNTAFEYQSKIGRATGVAQSPKWVRDAIAKHMAEVEARTPKPMYLSNDSSKVDDPNELG